MKVSYLSFPKLNRNKLLADFLDIDVVILDQLSIRYGDLMNISGTDVPTGLSAKEHKKLIDFLSLVRMFAIPKRLPVDPVLQESIGWLLATIAFEENEIISTLSLDHSGNAIGQQIIGIGSTFNVYGYICDVFKWATRTGAGNIIIAHNHPRSDVEPTETDLITLNKLIEAGNLLGIGIMDYIICMQNAYLSMAARKYPGLLMEVIGYEGKSGIISLEETIE
jgi:DNA repair protein RadC